MKDIKDSILLRILLCLGLAGVAYLWSTALMDSLYAYRSPLQHNPPQPGAQLIQNVEQLPTRRVVFVLVDALRERYLVG